MIFDSQNDQAIREQLLKVSRDLHFLARAEGKPVSVVLAEARAKLEGIIGAGGADGEAFKRITAAELASAKFDLTYLVEGLLVKDQPAGLLGPKKSLKTNISIDLAVSLATGGRFLGYFNVPEPKRMAVMSGESGMATIQETALRICDAAGVSLPDTDIIFSETLPRFGDLANMQAFRRFLEHDRIEVVVIDPAYMCLPPDVNPANLFDMGRMLRSVCDVCREAGSTLVLAHHLRKNVANPYAPGQLEDIAFSGFAEFFRQWIILTRREAYDPGSGMHRLWFSTGGSAGHGCLLGLDIFEGVYDPTGRQPRVWDVSVLKSGEVIRAAADRREDEREAEKARRSQSQLKRDMTRLINVLLELPGGDTLTALTDRAGLSRKRGRDAADALTDDGHIVACQVIKGNNKRKLQGYKLARFDQKNDLDDPEKTTRTSLSASS